ncbi:MAG TPA: G1 family glutamic endopeptidase, partial [Candidatus Binatus sp.]|nr:G1 family glutamic endopeptidase [Candidatus Binatus sp.]
FCATSKCAPHHIDETLIQLGTEQDAVSDSESDYYAWWETLPEPSVPIPTLNIAPGDTITAALSCANSCDTGDWTLSMTDVTTGVNWTQEFSYASPNLSAEVIEEAPFDGGILPLANYHKTSFTATMANSKSADLTSGASIVMVDHQPHHRTASSNVSAPNSSHDGFDACFNSKKSLAPCPKP